MWLQQSPSVPESQPPGACGDSGRQEPEVRGSKPGWGQGRGWDIPENLGNGKNGSSAGGKEWDSHQMTDLTKGRGHPGAPLGLRGWTVLGKRGGFLPF